MYILTQNASKCFAALKGREKCRVNVYNRLSALACLWSVCRPTVCCWQRIHPSIHRHHRVAAERSLQQTQ